MQKKKIVQLLRNADEKTIEQLSIDYPGLTDAEREALFNRIEQSIQNVQSEAVSAENAEEADVIRECRFSRIFSTAAVAACMLGLCGTFAGLFWMTRQMQINLPPEVIDSTVLESSHAYGIRERYAAENLTQSGTLWVTVTGVETTEASYHVYITLESEQAVSISEWVMQEPYLFMADNFMAATELNGENWITVQPYKFRFSGEQGNLPYIISVHPGEKCELELWFRLNELPAEWMLVTNYSADYPYTVITMKED